MIKNSHKITDIGAIILAGGKSKRFGTDKALYPYKGKPLIRTVIEIVKKITDKIIIVTNSPKKMEFINYPKYKDLIPGSGSLGGIYTGLYYSNAKVNIVLPCDMPYVSAACIKFLIDNTNGNDITVPFHKNMLEPLCAIYSKKCLPFIKTQIETKDYQIFQFYDEVWTKQIQFSSDLSFYHNQLFYNINSMEDLLDIG